MTPPLISVRDLRVAYGSSEVLHGVTFDVNAAETLVILGGSGSGKSTLLRTLVGLQRPKAGSVLIKGLDVCRAGAAELRRLRRHLGMSFQEGALFGSMTVGENIALPLREHTNLAETTIQIMVRLKLEQVGLEGLEDHLPSELSGGMRKRAAVARALALDPEMLFFDEPSAGLDPIVAAGMDHLILELKPAFRMTIVVVTHELVSAFLIADRMVLMDRGRIIAMGTPAEMRSNAHPRVRQFLDRVPEPETTGQSDYFRALMGERRSDSDA